MRACRSSVPSLQTSVSALPFITVPAGLGLGCGLAQHGAAAFLRQLIGYYGDNLQGLVPRYLEFAMASFGRQQDQMRRTMEHTMGGFM
ncbi:MAG: PHB accumulation regulatory domain-containing protein, partial [Burkholderiales bacterium]